MKQVVIILLLAATLLARSSAILISSCRTLYAIMLSNFQELSRHRRIRAGRNYTRRANIFPRSEMEVLKICNLKQPSYQSLGKISICTRDKLARLISRGKGESD